MKENKGFTLVEILVTFGIISMILLIAVPSILGISKSIKNRAYETKKVSIVAAAEKYAQNNKDLFSEASIIEITVRTLLYYGYVDIDSACEEAIGCVINPINNTSMNDEKIVIRRNRSITQAEFGMLTENTIRFDKNNADAIAFDAISCIGQNCTNSSLPPIITRTGTNVQIIGWSTNPDSLVAEFGPTSNITLDNSNSGTTYYAITTEDLVATFYKNGADTIDGSTNSAVTKSCPIYKKIGNSDAECSVSVPEITRTGTNANVIGWANNSNSTTASLNNTIKNVTINSNKNYYAVSKEQVGMEFYKNGVAKIDNLTDELITKNCDIYNAQTTCEVVTPSITASTTKYTVKGWNTNSAAITASIGTNIKTAVTANTKYYAIQTTRCKSSTQSTVNPYTTSSSTALSTCQNRTDTNGCTTFSTTAHVGSQPYHYSYDFEIVRSGSYYYCHVSCRTATQYKPANNLSRCYPWDIGMCANSSEISQYGGTTEDNECTRYSSTYYDKISYSSSKGSLTYSGDAVTLSSRTGCEDADFSEDIQTRYGYKYYELLSERQTCPSGYSPYK